MEKNATVAPAPDARPIASMFAEKPMLDASLTRTDLGVWYLTGTPFRDKEGRYWTTLFGNHVTASWRRHFGLAPLEIGDDRAIRVLSAEDQ